MSVERQKKQKQEQKQERPITEEKLLAKGRLSDLVNDEIDTVSYSDRLYVTKGVHGPDNTDVTVSRSHHGLVNYHASYEFHMKPADRSWDRRVQWNDAKDSLVHVVGTHEGEPYDYILGADKIDEVAGELEHIFFDQENAAVNFSSNYAPRVGETVLDLLQKVSSRIRSK